MTETSDPLLAWQVVAGPFSLDDLPPEELEGIPEDAWEFWVELMVSYKSEPDYWDVAPMYFSTLDECYMFKNRVDYSMGPLELSLDGS